VRILKSMLTKIEKKMKQVSKTTHIDRRQRAIYVSREKQTLRRVTYPIVVIKLGVNESSEKRSRRQLLPTPFERERERAKKKITNMLVVSTER
jgi:hypothetical protein